jgi:Fe(3+) dicitrate transport protein
MKGWILICSFLSTLAFSQTLEDPYFLVSGVVLDKEGKGFPAVQITNLRTKKKQSTDLSGFFEVETLAKDTLLFTSRGFDSLIYIVNTAAENLRIVLSAEVSDMGEVEVIRKRLEKFDVGFLPAIKGTQITTGTNSVISVESMNGAKSSGNPRELFARVPGLNIWESDGAGIQIGIGGRGLSPNRAENFNTRQNGYDISADALGYPESYYTPPIEALSSIEIVRGSASLQYGTQFGGLLNFILREPSTKSPLEITSRQTLGNYGYFGSFNRLSGSHKRFSYQTYYQLKTGNGYRENSNFTQHQAFAQLSYQITEKSRLRLEYTHMNYLAKQAGGLSDLNFAENDRQSLRDRNWFRVDWNMLALHYDHEFNAKTIFNVRAFGMQSSRQTLGFLGKITQADPGGNREMIAGDFKNAGTEIRLMRKYGKDSKDKLSIRGAVLVGGRYYRGQTSSLQGKASDGLGADFTFINPNDLENSAYQFPSENIALFTENILFIGDRFTVNGGFRFENIKSSASGFYKRYVIHPVNNDTLDVFTLRNENEVKRKVPLFGAGASFRINEKISTYLNFTQNYRAINFTDIRINNPNIVIDSAIRDEYGYTVELGFRGTVKKYWIFDMALFHIFYGDKIGLAPKAGTTLKERTNIGDALNSGVEVFTEFDLTGALNEKSKHQLSFFANAAYIQAFYIRSKETNYINKQVEYVAPFILRSGVKYAYEKWSSQLQGSFTSDQFSDASNAVQPSGDAVIGLVPRYFVVDFSCKYQLTKAWKIELSFNNLTNQKYFTRRAAAYPGPGILPSDGIQIFGTLQYQFAVKRK